MSPTRNRRGIATGPFRPKRFLSASDPTSLVVLCGAAVMTAIIVGAIFVVSEFRTRSIEHTQAEMENLAQLLSRHFDRHFDEIVASEHFIATFFERRNASQADYLGIVQSERFHLMLNDQVSASADKDSRIGLFDHTGDLIVSSQESPLPFVNISDREYFNSIKNQPPEANTQPQIAILNSRTHQEPRIVLARRLSGLDNQFLGLVTRTIPPSDLEQFLGTVATDTRTLLLVDSKRAVIARYPAISKSREQPLLETVLLERVFAPATSSGNPPSTSSTYDSIVASRQLSRYPVTVIAATPTSAALDSWNDETRTLIVVAALAAMVTGIMSGSIVRQLKEQTRRLDAAINNMPQALMLFDSSERLIIRNKRYLDMLGHSENFAIGRPFNDIIRRCRSNSDRFESLDAYCRSVEEARKTRGRTEHSLEMPDGRFLQVVNQGLDDGGWVSTIEDITERRRSEELTIQLAQFDILTGLPNRASFLEHLRKELSNSGRTRRLAVLFLDIDEFKAVNDTLGHHIGDQLLRSVAQRFNSCIEPDEFVARLGGDEFAFVRVGNPSRDEILALVARIFDSVRSKHQCGGHSLAINASIGVALAPDDGETVDSILQNADLAMYAAKSQGKRMYRFFERDMEARARERLELEIELASAVATGQIEAHFQPIYDIQSGAVVACEALARWNHPWRGFVSPATFIPIAEQAGLIGTLGETILRQACQEAMKWPSEIVVAVNVSPLQLRNSVFSLKVISALRDSGLPARRLEIEITEAVLIADDDAAVKILHDLRAIGVRISLDDFGTGYSSLSYLLRFPFDKIKIDRCFVERLTEDDTSRGIVKAAIIMASELHMITTAEGVENEAQRGILRELGCDQIQGHLMSPAASRQDIANVLNSRKLRRL